MRECDDRTPATALGDLHQLYGALHDNVEQELWLSLRKGVMYRRLIYGGESQLSRA